MTQEVIPEIEVGGLIPKELMDLSKPAYDYKGSFVGYHPRDGVQIRVKGGGLYQYNETSGHWGRVSE